MKNGKPQCKDIPNEEFLNAVEEIIAYRQSTWALRQEVTAVLAGHPYLVPPKGGWPAGLHVQVDYDQLIPQKLIIAKARKLIRRGLLTGCYCGCRGDFELTNLMIVGNTIYNRSEV